MMDDGFVNVRQFFAAGQSNQIGEGLGPQFPGFSSQAQRARAVDRGHSENHSRRDVWLLPGEGTHFEEHVQFKIAPRMFAYGSQAVGAEAKVDAGAGERAVRKFLVLEIVVAARAVNDVHAFLREQAGVAGREMVDVNREQVRS